MLYIIKFQDNGCKYIVNTEEETVKIICKNKKSYSLDISDISFEDDNENGYIGFAEKDLEPYDIHKEDLVMVYIFPKVKLNLTEIGVDNGL